MTSTPTAIDSISREITIAAPPETVFGFLTDPDRIVQWAGRSVTADARVGGEVVVDMNGFDIAHGKFVEVTPYTRVVYTWGWASLDPDALKPGASLVEYTLEPHGDGTLLKMVHSGLTALTAPGYDEGWRDLLARLASVSEGTPVEPLEPPLSAGAEYASRLNTVLINTVQTLEALPESAWKLPVPDDGRTVGVVASHLADHIGLVDIAVGVGKGGPGLPFTLAELDAKNAEDAVAKANITREEVIARIQRAGPPAVEQLKAITDAELATGTAMAIADGNVVTARDLIEGAGLASIGEHLEAIRAAASGA